MAVPVFGKRSRSPIAALARQAMQTSNAVAASRRRGDARNTLIRTTSTNALYRHRQREKKCAQPRSARAGAESVNAFALLAREARLKALFQLTDKREDAGFPMAGRHVARFTRRR